MAEFTSGEEAGTGEIPRAHQVIATLEIANEIARFFGQSVTLIETQEGPVLIAAQPGLSENQIAIAEQMGFTVVTNWDDIHAELNALGGAGILGLLPTRGVVTNQMCDSGEDNCEDQILGMLENSNFELRISEDRRHFEFLRRSTN